MKNLCLRMYFFIVLLSAGHGCSGLSVRHGMMGAGSIAAVSGIAVAIYYTRELRELYAKRDFLEQQVLGRSSHDQMTSLGALARLDREIERIDWHRSLALALVTGGAIVGASGVVWPEDKAILTPPPSPSPSPRPLPPPIPNPNPSPRPLPTPRPSPAPKPVLDAQTFEQRAHEDLVNKLTIEYRAGRRLDLLGGVPNSLDLAQYLEPSAAGLMARLTAQEKGKIVGVSWPQSTRSLLDTESFMTALGNSVIQGKTTNVSADMVTGVYPAILLDEHSRQYLAKIRRDGFAGTSLPALAFDKVAVPRDGHCGVHAAIYHQQRPTLVSDDEYSPGYIASVASVRKMRLELVDRMKDKLNDPSVEMRTKWSEKLRERIPEDLRKDTVDENLAMYEELVGLVKLSDDQIEFQSSGFPKVVGLKYYLGELEFELLADILQTTVVIWNCDTLSVGDDSSQAYLCSGVYGESGLDTFAQWIHVLLNVTASEGSNHWEVLIPKKGLEGVLRGEGDA